VKRCKLIDDAARGQARQVVFEGRVSKPLSAGFGGDGGFGAGGVGIVGAGSREGRSGAAAAAREQRREHARCDGRKDSPGELLDPERRRPHESLHGWSAARADQIRARSASIDVGRLRLMQWIPSDAGSMAALYLHSPHIVKFNVDSEIGAFLR
jgi:hypothetical protein